MGALIARGDDLMLGLIGEEFVDGLAHAGAFVGFIVIEHHGAAGNHAGIEEIEAIPDGTMDIHIDIDQAEALVLDRPRGLGEEPDMGADPAVTGEKGFDRLERGVGEVAPMMTVDGRVDVRHAGEGIEQMQGLIPQGLGQKPRRAALVDADFGHIAGRRAQTARHLVKREAAFGRHQGMVSDALIERLERRLVAPQIRQMPMPGHNVVAE